MCRIAIRPTVWGMIAETITINGANGDAINAYFARPLGDCTFNVSVRT